TYYYAVCAYDKGYYDDFYDRGLVELPNLLPKAPAICEKNIQVAASGEVIALDVNTIQVIPNAPAAGYIDAPVLGTDNGNVDRISGEGTGRIVVEALDPIKVQADAEYEISFDENGTYDIPGLTEVFVDTTFSIKDLRYFTQSVKVDTEWTMLKRHDIDSLSVTVSVGGVEYVAGVDFEIGYTIGNIRALPEGDMPYGQGESGEISYQYYVINNSPYVNSEEINGHFDGYHITVYNDTLRASQERSQWLSGDLQQHYLAQYGFIGTNDPIPAENQPPTNYNYQVSAYTNQGVKVPADYHLVVYDEVVTMSVNRKMANFRLFNAATGDTSDFVFFDTDKDSMLSSGDYLTPTLVVNRRTRGTWQMKFTAPRDSIVLIDSLDANGTIVKDKEGEPYKIAIDTIYVDKVKPRGGDIFYLAVNKPFSGSDKFTFKAQPPSVDYEKAESENELDKIAVVPNPYVVTVSWEPQHFYSSGRGIRKIDFIHLPPQCTIRVFSMRGHLVDTIEHDSLINDGAESWDLLSKDGMEIAYGVYIFHVETPSGDSSVGKFAVIK
ncbi:hypothetical protein KAH55_05650, partial [bacterium]|nr:hypothetical protein [bacterium]